MQIILNILKNDENVDTDALSSSRQRVSISQVQRAVHFLAVRGIHLDFGSEGKWTKSSYSPNGSIINKQSIAHWRVNSSQGAKSNQGRVPTESTSIFTPRFCNYICITPKMQRYFWCMGTDLPKESAIIYHLILHSTLAPSTLDGAVLNDLYRGHGRWD